MGDLYRVEITDRTSDEVQARLVLISVQSADLPAKKNIALQVLTEMFYELFDEEYTFFDAFDPVQFAGYEDLESIEKRICLSRLAFHMADRYALFLAQAEKEIVWVKMIGDGNFEHVEAWEEALYDDRKPECEPWTEIRFKVRDPEILEHVEIGMRVPSRMFDKTE